MSEGPKKIDLMSERELKRALKEARNTIEDLYEMQGQLSKGIGGIVVDYQLYNESGIAAQRFLNSYA